MSAVVRGGDPELPAVITLQNPEAMDIWKIYKALDRRVLPTAIMAEPAAWIADMLTLDALYEALRPKGD